MKMRMPLGRYRRHLWALLTSLLMVTSLLPLVAHADGPITVDQAREIATSSGSDVDGTKYVGGGGKWDPFNWHRPDDGPNPQDQWGSDCSGFVAKVWQVDNIRDVQVYGHDISTASLACPGTNSIWQVIDNWNDKLEGDAFTNDTRGALMERNNSGIAYYVYAGIWNYYVSIGGSGSCLGCPAGESEVNNTYQPFEHRYIIWHANPPHWGHGCY